MRKLICKCTIGEVNTETDWVEDLEIFLEENEGNPARVNSEDIRKKAEREILGIVKTFNETETARMRAYGRSAKQRELKHFIVYSNQNYE